MSHVICQKGNSSQPGNKASIVYTIYPQAQKPKMNLQRYLHNVKMSRIIRNVSILLYLKTAEMVIPEGVEGYAVFANTKESKHVAKTCTNYI